MEQTLKDKKVLLFIPNTFNYPTIIYNKLQQLGAEAYLFDERSITSSIDKAILKINPHLFAKRTRKYYKKIINEMSWIEVDYILFVKCEMPTQKVLNELRTAFPNAKMCLHLWDSVENNRRILSKLKYFDIITSFDTKDCKKYGFKFRPLFFADEYSQQKYEGEYIYDIAFCGTIHSDRFQVIKKIRKQCDDLNLRYYGFHFLQGNLVYKFYKLTKREFKKTKPSDFAFEKKLSSDIAEIEKKSAAILDIQHPKQTGLTMRTIEMIGLSKKLITTNTGIREYDFYDENNILIIDRNKPEICKEFFLKPYNPIPENIFNKYTLESWIYDVLGIEAKEESNHS